MKILFATNDETQRKSIELLKKTYPVIDTRDGQSAIESYILNFQEICIIDENITQDGALEVVARIKELGKEFEKNPYIIMTTTSEQSNELIGALKSGVDQYITKKCDFSQLESLIIEAIPRLGIADVDLDGLGNPIDALIDEHRLLDELLDVMEVFYQNLDSTTPLEIIEWFSSTTFLLTLEVHEEKERYLVNSMIETFMMKEDELFHEFSTNHLIRVQEDHIKMLDLLGDIKNSINNYVSEYQDLMDEKPESIDTAYLVQIKKNFKQYHILMTGHIRMEEEIMFPFVKEHMTKVDVLEISNEFKNVHDQIGSRQIIKTIKEITSLKDAMLDSLLD